MVHKDINEAMELFPPGVNNLCLLAWILIFGRHLNIRDSIEFRKLDISNRPHTLRHASQSFPYTANPRLIYYYHIEMDYYIEIKRDSQLLQVRIIYRIFKVSYHFFAVSSFYLNV